MPGQSQSSPSKTRRARERVEMTARIKDIARDMFVREGYEAVTLQKIAAELEYTPPAIYRYFKDKSKLLVTIVLEDMAELHGLLLECAEIADPLDRLVEMARRNAAWAVTHPNHYLLFSAQAWRDREDEVRAELAIPLEQEPLFHLYQAVEEVIATGRIKQEYADATTLASTLWAGVHGTIMLEMTMSEFDRSLIQDEKRPFPKRLEVMMDGLMRGFLRD